MVPSLVIALSALPHTPNEKIDRKALLDPPLPGAGAAQPAEPTQDSVEALVVEVIARGLGLKEVDLDKGFFELGGTSMTAVIVHRESLQPPPGEVPSPSSSGIPRRAPSRQAAGSIGGAAARRSRRAQARELSPSSGWPPGSRLAQRGRAVAEPRGRRGHHHPLHRRRAASSRCA